MFRVLRVWKFWLMAFITAIALMLGAQSLNYTLAQTPPEESVPVPNNQNLVLPTIPTYLPLSSQIYQEPAARFGIGILDGYKVLNLQSVTVMENEDGTLAYTVVVHPRASDSPLPPSAVAQIAIETFLSGEEFTPQPFQELTEGIIIPWSGTLSQQNQNQPMGGLLYAKQGERDVLLLMVSATAENIPYTQPAINTLLPTFKAL
jgi:hypothetical protein